MPQKKCKIKGSPPHLNTVNLSGEPKVVNTTEYTRILGMNIAGNMSMRQHIESGEKNMLNDLRRKLGAVKHLGKQLPERCRKQLAAGLIMGKIMYAFQRKEKLKESD